MKYIAIDPGVTGALATVHLESSEDDVHDLPVVSIGSTRQISPQDLTDLLVAVGPVKGIILEDNRANSVNGSKANYSMGLSMGVILGVAGALGRRIVRVKPREWQKQLGLSSVPANDRKEAHRQRARELFPHLDHRLNRKKDHNRADALLMGQWATEIGV